MDIKLGSTPINKLYLGSTEIKKMYLGGNIWTSAPAALGYGVFDGSSYIEYPSFNITDNLKVSAKIRSVGVQTDSVGVVAGKYTGLNRSWFIGILQSGGVRVYLSQTGSSSADKRYESTATVQDGDIIGFTFINGDAGDDLKLYINNIQASVTKPIDDPVSSLFSSSVKPRIGALSDDDAYFSGQLDYVKIYENDVLETNWSPEEFGDLDDHGNYTGLTTNNGVTFVPL